MSDLPKIDPRDRVLAIATSEAQQEFAKLIERHELTYGEVFVVLGALTQSWAYWQVKEERGKL